MFHCTTCWESVWLVLVQVLCMFSQSLWVHMCNYFDVFRKQYFLVLILCLWLTVKISLYFQYFKRATSTLPWKIQKVALEARFLEEVMILQLGDLPARIWETKWVMRDINPRRAGNNWGEKWLDLMPMYLFKTFIDFCKLSSESSAINTEKHLMQLMRDFPSVSCDYHWLIKKLL